MEKVSGKQIIFRIGEIGNSESRGWIQRLWLLY